MAINEFPTFSNDQDPEFKAHFEAAWEDASNTETPPPSDHGDHLEFETPPPSDHGDHLEFETPPPANVEGQEFLEPERNQMGDPLAGEAPGIPELAIDLHDSPEPPRPQGDLGFAEPGAIEGQTVYESQGPVPVAPLDLEGFEAPAAGESRQPNESEGPLQYPSIPWAFPMPPQDSEEPEEQQFQGPSVEDIGETEEYQPPLPSQNQSQLAFDPSEAPGVPDLAGPSFQPPQQPPVELTPNEDLFARTGWSVQPPRIRQTHWMM